MIRHTWNGARPDPNPSHGSEGTTARTIAAIKAEGYHEAMNSDAVWGLYVALRAAMGMCPPGANESYCRDCGRLLGRGHSPNCLCLNALAAYETDLTPEKEV